MNKLKYICIGDTNVGKSSYLEMLVHNRFNYDYQQPTIGINLFTMKYELNDKIYNLNLWDTAGMEYYKSICKSYYTGSHGILLMYDITRIGTFTNIRKWIKDIDDICEVKPVMILIGNKIDNNNRMVSTEKGQSFAKKNGLLFAEISVKQNIHLHEVITLLTTEVIKKNITIENLKIENLKPEKKCCY